MLTRHRMARLCSALALFAGLAMAATALAAAVDPPLIDAVKRQDAEAVRRLLGDGVEVDTRQPDGATALHWAVYREDLETVDLLLRAGATVDAVNRMGATPLWLAAGNGDPAAIARLLEAGANPNVALRAGETPVMTAARSGTAEGVRLLVEAGADVHARETSREQTALMWAVTQGQHPVVQVLLEAGADMEARSKVRPRLMYDVGPNAAVFDQGVIVNLGGFTPLLFAARHGDVESARLLLAAGADVDNPAANGASPLVVATHSGHTAFAVLLLAEGAEPDTIGAGYTALHAAVLRGDLTTVETLLARGAGSEHPAREGHAAQTDQRGLDAERVVCQRNAVLARGQVPRAGDHAGAGGRRRRPHLGNNGGLARGRGAGRRCRSAAGRGRFRDATDGGVTRLE